MLGAIIGDNPAARDGQVLIEAGVLATIHSYRQNASRKPEAGGILLGCRRGIHLHVIEATVPTQMDRRGPMHFERSSIGHQETAINRWIQSGGTVDYIGEWHSHPEIMPYPSRIDQEAWRAISRTHAPYPMIFIIVGTSGRRWSGLGQHDTLQELHLN